MLQQIIILRKAGGDGILGHCHNKVLPDPSRAGVTLCTHRALIALERGSACVRTFLFWSCVCLNWAADSTWWWEGLYLRASHRAATWSLEEGTDNVQIVDQNSGTISIV